MGFSLDAYLVFAPGAVEVFERLVPGGGRLAVPVPRDPEIMLPRAWLLPRPWVAEADFPGLDVLGLEHALTELSRPIFGEAEIASPKSCRAVGADHLLCSALSLAGPPGVLWLWDETFAGILAGEAAMAYRDGTMIAVASGSARWALDPREPRGTPVAFCAAHLDPRFDGAFLYDGYFPRHLDPDDAEPPPLEPWLELPVPARWPEELRRRLRPRA